MKSKQFVLASRPHGLPSSENFRMEETDLAEVKDGEVLLKSWYISVDPYMRGRMNEGKTYAAPYQIDQPVYGSVVAKVIESKSGSFNTNDIVIGILPWATYSIENAEKLRKVDPQIAPPSYNLSILGMPGLTAYFGMKEIGKPKAGETVVISGAAGAVGIIAGQIARIHGCNVVGISGSDEKCILLKEQFGYNETLNYKTSKRIKIAIAEICPGGVDVYYDNVGGEISDGVIANLNNNSRIVLCGQISQYNNTIPRVGPSLFPLILSRSIHLQGFIVRNYSNRFGEGFSQLTEWMAEGKLKAKETILHGFEKLPEAFLGLFSGMNFGKLLVESDE